MLDPRTAQHEPVFPHAAVSTAPSCGNSSLDLCGFYIRVSLVDAGRWGGPKPIVGRGLQTALLHGSFRCALSKTNYGLEQFGIDPLLCYELMEATCKSYW